MRGKLKIITTKDLPEVRVGDMLKITIYPDSATVLYNAQKVTSIQKNGILRISCIDGECKNTKCTYLRLYQSELKLLKINNSIEKIGRLGGMTM